MSKPSIPKGTRDFNPDVMIRRNHIFSVIRKAFELYGFAPIETPAMENLSTLTGKYGDEGDRLIFKIRSNKNLRDKLSDEDKATLDGIYSEWLPQKSETALRYDLTVPFARFVVMNQNDLSFPFRRYQIQPVWRADRPQKGRYREFYQCDVDVIGSDSLISEMELVQIIDRVLSELQIPDFTIKLNNRKILAGIAEKAGIADKFVDMTVAIDKLDKIGEDGVIKELRDRGISEGAISFIEPLFKLADDNGQRLEYLAGALQGSETGEKGLSELGEVLNLVEAGGLESAKLQFDPLLARGLDYYTGAIFEVVVNNVSVGSISGGGRYDDLTGIFGMPGMSGVGISFGADRIYDVMNELNLFPEKLGITSEVMFTNFGDNEQEVCLELLNQLRQAGVRSEIYPDQAKMKKQMKYANDKGIPYVAIVGSQEIEKGKVALKDMVSGDQTMLEFNKLSSHIVSNR